MYIHTRIHTYIHTYIHTHIHIIYVYNIYGSAGIFPADTLPLGCSRSGTKLENTSLSAGAHRRSA